MIDPTLMWGTYFGGAGNDYGYDIAVNAITPAAANTPILKDVPKDFIEYMVSRIPRGRFLEGE